MNPSVMCFRETPVAKKFEDKRGGVSRFTVENYLYHSDKIFLRGESFTVSLISGIKIFYASESYVTTFDFLSNVFCPTVPNNLVDEPFCDVFQKLRWRKNLKIRGGGGSIKIYRRKLFVSQ